MKSHPAKGSIKFPHPGISRLHLLKFESMVKVQIVNNIEIKGEISLSKDEAMEFAIDLLAAVRGMEE